MRKEPSIFKALVGSFLVVGMIAYIVVFKPYIPSDTLVGYTKEDVPINVKVPARYEAKANVKKAEIQFKSTKDKIKRVKNEEIELTVVVEGKEGQYDIKPTLEDMDEYIYKIKPETVTIDVVKIKPETVKPKVIIKGTPKKPIRNVEVKDKLQGYFKQSDKDILDRVEIEVNADKLQGVKELEGTVRVRDLKGDEMNKKIINKDKVKVKVETD